MRIIVVGAGGHAKVVIDTAQEAGHDVVAVLDSRTDISELLGAPLVADVDAVNADGFVVALGDNRTRRERFERMTDLGFEPVSIVHPHATVARTAVIGAGSVLFAGVIVNADAAIGRDVILNTACTVDHDCLIGDHAHVAPGVNLCGNVHVGEGTLVGVGASAAPGSRIGSWATVGAGATVIGEIASDVTCVGTPARVLRTPSTNEGPK